MKSQKIIEYIEDKTFVEQKQWFLHAVENNIKMIQTILSDGLKCTYLSGLEKPTTSNGKYYISLFKNDENLVLYVKDLKVMLSLLLMEYTHIMPIVKSIRVVCPILILGFLLEQVIMKGSINNIYK